ncbi:TAZ protein, partial [Pseudoatta argentina]
MEIIGRRYNIYLCGGTFDNGIVNKNIWRYSLISKKWFLETMIILFIYWTATFVKNKLILVGGRGKLDEYSENIDIYDIYTEWLNKTTVYNKHIIVRALDLRPKNVPLITVSNHHSCFDDPGIWATLDFRHSWSRRKLRWSLAAHDICFTNVWHSYFFMLGKCIPIIRGDGVYQEAVDFCIERLALGEWVHVFPEGKVNMCKEEIRLKWGVGRLILESPITPIVIPICHLGMDEVLPNEPPYMLKVGKRVTMNYGEPIDFSGLLTELRESKAGEMDARKAITDRIQQELSR